MQTASGKPASTKVLEDYCRDLCQQARDKSIDVVRPAPVPLRCVCLLQPSIQNTSLILLQLLLRSTVLEPQAPSYWVAS